MKKTIIAASILLLTSCATPEKLGPTCPQAGLLPGAATIPIFVDEVNKEDLRVLGEVGSFKGACRYKTGKPAEFHLELDFMAKKLPKAGDLKGLKFPYFIAVLSPNETILQKDRFWTKIDFDNNDAVIVKEEHDIKIPVDSAAAGGDYKIVFGFELTIEQLAFNRGQNLKPDAIPKTMETKK